ncbi:MAG TPA: class I SAM-dependent methyltransferase [Candidatus Paceibacterota bacterium]|nr:class I SAM-dependent methyltransferase [Candidatus Paceibacterota bacterium]
MEHSESSESEVYEKALAYWPYKQSLDKVLQLVDEMAPKTGTLLDVMCGPGYLLGKIAEKHPGLALWGVDIDRQHISYCRRRYQRITFERGDLLDWHPTLYFSVVLCTGALHHFPDERQEDAIANIAQRVQRGGFAIISDCYIEKFSSERGRKVASAKLESEYLMETIRNGAPDDVIAYTADILKDNVLMKEYKTSLEVRMPILDRHFDSVQTFKTWPSPASGYGDYVHVCSNA